MNRMKITTTIIALLVSLVLMAQNESDFYTPPSHTGVSKNLVTDYNAIPNDGKDDSEALQNAIDDVTTKTNGGKIYIPEGTYHLVFINLESNVHLEFDEEAIIIPAADTSMGNYAIFQLGRDQDYIENVQISAKTGKFTVDFRGVENADGRVVSLYSVDNFSVSDIVVLDELTKFSAVTGGISKHNNNYLKPKNGLVKNIEVHNAHYGYGVVQMQTGQKIFFKNLWGDGGVTLRFETGYNKMNLLQVGGVYDFFGKNIYCENGNAAVMISPHATDNGHVEVDSIEAVNCGFAVRIGGGYANKEQDSVGLDGGYFANTSKVSNVKATYGTTAQVKSKHFKYMACAERSLISAEKGPDGESYVAPSIAAIVNTAEGTGDGKFTVTMTNVESIGFPNQAKDILSDEDAVEDCSTATREIYSSDIEIYPTIVNDVVNIKYEGTEALNYQLLNLSGQQIMSGVVDKYSLEIPSSLPAGLYFFNLCRENTQETFRLIKR